MIAFLAPAAGDPGPPMLAAKERPKNKNTANTRSLSTPWAAQVALYMPIITGIRIATKAWAERNAEDKDGKEDECKGPGALDGAQQQQSYALIQPRPAHAHRHDQDSQDEDDGIVHECLGDFIGRKNPEDEHEDGHQCDGTADGQPLRSP